MQGLSETIAAHLPYLRRYARALTGSQATGDNYAVATLEAVVQDRSIFDGTLAPRVALFKAFHADLGQRRPADHGRRATTCRGSRRRRRTIWRR